MDRVNTAFEPIEAVKHYLADFVRLGGTPPTPPTPLTENHFAKKPLAERGDTPAPSPLTESAKLFRKLLTLKWLKMMFLY